MNHALIDNALRASLRRDRRLIESLISNAEIPGIPQHHRAVHAPLGMVTRLRSRPLARQEITPLVGPFADELGAGAIPAGNSPASSGSEIAVLAWKALALQAASAQIADASWAALARSGIAQLVANQQASGAFLLATRSDNPETLWYHELAILHAITSYAIAATDSAALASAARAAEYHLNETQPDHATTQPWGLTAMLISAPARILGEQMLHAVQTQARVEPVSLMLLRDVVYSLRLLTEDADP
jgi:hypothetical protein